MARTAQPSAVRTRRSRATRSLLAVATALGVALLPLLSPLQDAAGAADPLAEVVATTASAGYTETGIWSAACDPGYNGGVNRYSRDPGATATWTLVAPKAGTYKVGIYHVGSVDNAPAAPYTWTGGGSAIVDQRADGNSWHNIGGVTLEEGQEFSITVTAMEGPSQTKPDQNVITRTDAVRLSEGVPCGTVTGSADPVQETITDFPGYQLRQDGTTVALSTEKWSMDIDLNGFRYSLVSGGESAAAAHPVAGLTMGAADDEVCDAISASLVDATAEQATFSVPFSGGRTATAVVVPDAESLNLQVTADDGRPSAIRAQLAGGLNPAYGLGDLGGWRSDLSAYGVKDLDYYAANSSGTTNQRFVSNFTVFPTRDLAQVALDRGRLAIEVDDDATMFGVVGTSMPELHYFFGDMETIYRNYAQVRNEAGYLDARPDYEYFGVGYESYGALSYDTNQATIEGSVAEYLEQGYPITWAVTGSGFWPYGEGGGQGTTSSFGMWGNKYPDPDGYKQFFADRGIDLILGLRQSFKALPEDGGNYDPLLDGTYTQDGIDNGYFITNDDGTPRAFSTISFPSGKVYLIDPDNPDAIEWFVENSRQWGVDGYKEDHMFNASTNGFYDNGLVNPIDEALAADGNLMMVRNSAFSVPGSILRINDTDYNQGGKDRDRTVVNGLAYAASGQANFYPDIVGGRMMPDLETNVVKQKYLTRNAMMAAMSPSMSFGNEPWRMGTAELREATVKAAQWHSEYQPYIYSAAVDSFETGYPSTATPLPIAYPDDPATYDLVSYAAKQYEWMMGPSLLVNPIYGSDFATAVSRDVYLPEGEWMDFETGERFTGPTTLEDYTQPFGKIPAFVGGAGILVNSVADAGVAAQVFPVAPQGAEYEYIASDGRTRSTITADNTLWSAAEIKVIESGSGDTVPFTVDETTGAVEFAVTAGVDYVVSDRDLVPPAVELTISEAGAEGWYRAGATAALSATDDASGVDTVEYDLDGSGWTAYSTGVVLPEGDHTLEYRSTDNEGNTSEAQSPWVRVDATDGSVWGWLDLDGTLTVVAKDALSGVGAVEYSLDGATWTASMPELDPALDSVRIRVTDVAGNVGDPLLLEEASEAPPLTVEPGEVLVVERSGFDPGAEVRVELHSDPVRLGTVTATTSGLVRLTATVPESVSAGTHSLVFVVAGDDPGTVPVEVASTGADPLPWLVIAAILLAAGAGLILVRSRRKKEDPRPDAA